MSYGINMLFSEASDKAEALDRMSRFVSNAFIRRKEWLELNKGYIPSARYGIEERMAGKIANENWLYRLFSFEFVWWEEKGIIGVISHDFLKNDDFSESVYFQNSCDQNYSYDEWPQIPYFTNIVEKYRNADDNVLKKELSWYDSDTDIGYARRTLVYEKIERGLDIQGLLGFNDSEVGGYQRFVMAAPINDMELMQLRVFGETLVGPTRKSKPIGQRA